MKATLPKKVTGYVSCIRYHGIPILPPVLTEEVRRQAQIYREQAILVEKQFALRRKQKAEEKERRNQKISQNRCNQDSENETIDESTSEVMDFIRYALGDSNDLEEVKLLISQVSDELQKRRSVRSLESSFTNSAISTPKSELVDTNARYERSYFDRESSCESIIFNDDVTQPNNLSSIIIEAMLPEVEVIDSHLKNDSTGSNTKLENTLSGISDITNKIITPASPDNNSISTNKSEIPLDTNNKDLLDSPSDEGMSTPAKAIRRNSYTLESPSPSILAYFRTLTLDNSSENCVMSSNKVVRNLSNLWDIDQSELEQSRSQSVGEIIISQSVVPSIEDSVFPINLPQESPDHLENNRDASNAVEIRNDSTNNLVLKEKKLNFAVNASPENKKEDISEKKLKAVLVIQSASRGFFIRRIMRTKKVEDLKDTIKSAVVCAWSMYDDQAVTPADLHLHERIINQVNAACYELHSIFFKWSTEEKLALIRSDRERLKIPKPKPRSSRYKTTSESDSISSSTRSRSVSSASVRSKQSGRTTLRERPTTLPSVPRSSVVMKYQPWK